MQTAASKQNQKKWVSTVKSLCDSWKGTHTSTGGKKCWITHSRDNKDERTSAHAHKTKKKHEKQAPYSGNTQKKNLLFSGRRSSKVWKKEDDVFKTPTPIHTYTQKYIVFLLFLSSFKKKKTSLLKRHREKQKSPNKKKAVFQGKRSLLTTTTCFLKKKKRRKRTPLWDTEKKKLHHSRE